MVENLNPLGRAQRNQDPAKLPQSQPRLAEGLARAERFLTNLRELNSLIGLFGANNSKQPNLAYAARFADFETSTINGRSYLKVRLSFEPTSPQEAVEINQYKRMRQLSVEMVAAQLNVKLASYGLMAKAVAEGTASAPRKPEWDGIIELVLRSAAKN
jgi:hypothetical protein